MKLNFKIAAVFTALVLAFAFSGCKTLKSSKSSEVVFKADVPERNMENTMTFSDGTFRLEQNVDGTLICYEGRYTGNPSVDGKISIWVYYLGIGGWFDGDEIWDSKEEPLTIADGRFTLIDLEFVRQ